MKFLSLLVCFVFIACGHGKKDKTSHVSFLPENTLFTADDPSLQVNANGIDEAYFNALIAKAQDIFAPIVAQHGANLVITGNWSDSTVNAYASRSGNIWEVKMFGGMARRSEITKDGFALVICHELHHHLSGFPTYAGEWAANEGNSDFGATAGCAERMLSEADPVPTPAPDPTPVPTPKPPCPFVPEVDATPCKGFSFGGNATVCQRSIDGSISLGKLLAVLGGTKIPSINTPDKTVVTKTSDKHPNAQCRLDTMYLGVLCSQKWNYGIIPQNKNEMAMVSCSSRPRCWYAP